MVAGEGQQIVDLLIRRVRLDVHPNADRLITDRARIIQGEKALQVDITAQLGGKPVDLGNTLIEYLQNLRIEEAKRLLEAGPMPVDDVSIESGYEDASFFRRLFKRLTGLSPGQYRRLFQPVMNATDVT